MCFAMSINQVLTFLKSADTVSLFWNIIFGNVWVDEFEIFANTNFPFFTVSCPFNFNFNRPTSGIDELLY